MPDEVFLIDNNCTDDTVAIAKEFPFVKILHEPNQGLIAARNHGFKAARGELLARIDCDARLPKDWVERVKAVLADRDIAAVTGLADTCAIPYLPWPRTTIWSRLYFMDSPAFFRVPLLWGSNMAMRQTAWKTIARQICADDKVVHEDQDMSILLAAHHLRVVIDKKLKIRTGGEQFGYLPKVLEYAHRRGTTKAHHHKLGTLRAAQDYARMSGWAVARRYLLLPFGLFFISFAAFDTLVQHLSRRPL